MKSTLNILLEGLMLKLQLPIAYDVCVYIYIHTLTHTHIYLFYKLYSHLFFYLPHFLTISQSSWHVLTKCKLIYVIIRRENCPHRKKSNYFKLSRNWLLSYLMLTTTYGLHFIFLVMKCPFVKFPLSFWHYQIFPISRIFFSNFPT